MSIRPLLSEDSNNLLRLVENLKKPTRKNELIKFSYFLCFDKNGNFETETLEIENDVIIHPVESRKNGIHPIIFKNFKKLEKPGNLMLESEACWGLAPYLHSHLGLCDFKISIDLENIDLHEKDKPFQYKIIVGWETDKGFNLSDDSSDYTFLVKDFRIMRDY